jgi:outer membrane lipoprotein-sorting protein
MKRNRYFIPLGALLALFALGAVVILARASADDMLQQAARLLAGAQDGHAIVEVQIDTPQESASGKVEVWGRRDAGAEGEPAFRVEILESSKPEAIGMVAVGDGDQVWFWNPQKNTVYVGTRDELKARMAEHQGKFDPADFDHPDFNKDEMPQSPEEAVAKLLEYFTAERNGSEVLLGEDGSETAVEKLRMIPIPEQMPEEFRANGGLLNLLLRSSDGAPLSAEYAGGAMGYAKATATLLELDVDVAPETFSFDIPHGAEVVNLADMEPPASLTVEEAAEAADFAVLSPSDLPAGARLEGINEVRGAVVQRYRLPDGKRFTIAQGPASAAEAPGENGEQVTVRGREALLFVDDAGLEEAGSARSLLTWREGEETVWIGGDLTRAEALAVAESLR